MTSALPPWGGLGKGREERTGKPSGGWLQRVWKSNASHLQLVRFAFVGGVSSLLYAGVFILLQKEGSQLANLSGAVLSTLLANEMHRRLTFRAGAHVGWLAAQWEGGGLAVVGLVATSLALMGLHQLVGKTSWGVELLLIAGVTALIGGVRFVVLRMWVFPRRRQA